MSEARSGIAYPVTYEEAHRAAQEWGANCGPVALAGICRMSLEEVREHMGNFESKRYTNPLLMWQALKSIGVPHERKTFRDVTTSSSCWPRYGLARIQFHGPWMDEGRPRRARYRWSHWVGAMSLTSGVGVFDVNALNNGSGWVSLSEWEQIIVPHIIQYCVPLGDGDWSFTHVVEVTPLNG